MTSWSVYFVFCIILTIVDTPQFFLLFIFHAGLQKGLKEYVQEAW